MAAAERGFLAEAAAEVRHGLRDRVLALLEPGLLAKQRHVILSLFQAGDAGGDLLRLHPGGGEYQPRGQANSPQ